MRRLGSGLVVLAVGFVLGALAMHFGMHGGHADQMEALPALQAQVGAVESGQAAMQSELAATRSQLDIEVGTRKALEESLRNAQRELGRTRDQLAFYEQLIPPGPAGTVTIRAFDTRRQGELLRYRVLLTRNAPGKPAFKGSMRFVANGRQGEKAVKIELSAAALDSSAAVSEPPQTSATNQFALAFDQFQRSTGILRIPPDFFPESITLDILEEGVIRATRKAGIDGAGDAPEKVIGAPQ